MPRHETERSPIRAGTDVLAASGVAAEPAVEGTKRQVRSELRYHLLAALSRYGSTDCTSSHACSVSVLQPDAMRLLKRIENFPSLVRSVTLARPQVA
jgi:hypothetical protein